MTTIAQTSVFNVQASLNAWLRGELAGISKPSWLPAYTLTTSNPEAAASMPAFSVNHIPVAADDRWQGRAVGGTSKGLHGRGIMEINVWVSRSARNWLAMKRTMTDMVLTAAGRTTAVVIDDHAANLNSPAATSYLVRIGDVQPVETAADPNVDVERQRILVDYEWTYRSN